MDTKPTTACSVFSALEKQKLLLVFVQNFQREALSLLRIKWIGYTNCVLEGGGSKSDTPLASKLWSWQAMSAIRPESGSINNKPNTMEKENRRFLKEWTCLPNHWCSLIVDDIVHGTHKVATQRRMTPLSLSDIPGWFEHVRRVGSHRVDLIAKAHWRVATGSLAYQRQGYHRTS